MTKRMWSNNNRKTKIKGRSNISVFKRYEMVMEILIILFCLIKVDKITRGHDLTLVKEHILDVRKY